MIIRGQLEVSVAWRVQVLLKHIPTFGMLQLRSRTGLHSHLQFNLTKVTFYLNGKV